MSISKLACAVAAGAILGFAASSAPVSAASPMTSVFMDNAMPNVDFLDRSSRMALDHTKNARIREFAKSEAAEQTNAVNALYDWSQSDRKTAQADADVVKTGRSVAVAGEKAPIVDMRLPAGQEDLDRLDGLADGEFDTLYKDRQKDALKQIESDYQAYIAKGDDPVLLGIANQELPKVRHRQAELNRL